MPSSVYCESDRRPLTVVPYVYKAEVLAALLEYGARPTPDTNPEMVHEFVGDLYRYEIRRLRERLRRKEFPKPEYYGRVVELRNKYRILSMRPREWLSDEA